jgi:hypothetical protein
MVDEKGEVIKKDDNEEKLDYEIRDRESGNVLVSGEAECGDELEMLLPDSQALEITVNGYTYDIEMKGS